MVGPSGITTHLISHIMVNPAKHSSVIILWTPTDNQGVYPGKAKDNSTTGTVLGSLPATSVRESTWSRTASSLQRKSPGTKDTDVAKHYKNKIQDAVWRGNITINEVSFTRVPETTYSIEQVEQLLGNLQLSHNSD